MTYSIWGTFAGRQARVFSGLSANDAANWIVRFRKTDTKHGYWMQSDY